MKVSVLLIEDEPMIAQDIELILLENDYDVIGLFYESGPAIIAAKERQPQLALLDINLQSEVDGIYIARQLNKQCSIIFITSLYDDSTLKRIEHIKPYAYILKPFQEQEILLNMRLALARKQIELMANTDSFITIKSKGFNVKIDLKDVLYLEGENNYTKLILKNAKTHLISKTINSVLNEDCTSADFIRVHKSYVINLKYLEGLNGKYAQVKGHSIPISRTYKRELLDSWRV